MSKFVTLHGFYGSGSISNGNNATGSNFIIKKYDTSEELLADIPVENTIGVITNTEITKYHFSNTDPTDAQPGEVCIGTGYNSTAPFDIVNGGTLYPIYIKQYINNAWTYMDAYMFKTDGWVQFGFAITYLFENGNLCKNITGGWSKSGYTISDFNSGSDNSKVTIGDSIVCQAVSVNPSDLAGACGTVNKINKDGFTTLRVKGNVSGYNSNARLYVGVNASKSLNASPTAKIRLTANGDFEKTLTLPNVTSFYVFVLAACYTGVTDLYTATLTVDSINLE